MSTYTTRIFVPSQGTKIGTRRTARAIADRIRQSGSPLGHRIRPTSQHGRVCIVVQSDYAFAHRRRVAFARRFMPTSWRDIESNQVAARALAQEGR